MDSYGGSLKYKVRYTLARGLSEPVDKPDVILVGNGRRLVYRRGSTTPARVVFQKEIKFTEVGFWLRKVLPVKTRAKKHTILRWLCEDNMLFYQDTNVMLMLQE